MIRRPPRSTPLYSSAASDVYKRQSVNDQCHVQSPSCARPPPYRPVRLVRPSSSAGDQGLPRSRRATPAGAHPPMTSVTDVRPETVPSLTAAGRGAGLSSANSPQVAVNDIGSAAVSYTHLTLPTNREV